MSGADPITAQPQTINAPVVPPNSKSSSPAVIDAQPMYPINRNLTATGLAALTQLDSLVLMEERDLMERLLGDKIPCGPWGLTCGPPEKRYSAAPSDDSQTKIFWLQEKSSCFPRRCWPRVRSLDVVAKDTSTDKELFRVVRDVNFLSCCTGTCWPAGCCGYFGKNCADVFKLSVTGPDHSPLGFVEQRKSCCSLEFEILDKSHQSQYTFRTGFSDGFLSNPCFVFPCVMPPCIHWLNKCGDVVAPLKNSSGQTVGSINWQYTGILETCLCAQHKFGVTFPKDADADMRATIIGATILFENFFGPWNSVFCC